MNAMTNVHPQMYVLLGCPGSGKGTFAQTIKPEGYEHISTGDIIRQKATNDREYGRRYDSTIRGHVIGGIPFQVIQDLVEERLNGALREQKGIILDGYPKTTDQCAFLDEFIQSHELKGKVVFLLFSILQKDAMDRILYRQTCTNEKCRKIYNSKFSPSKTPDRCDDCNEPLSKRIDDSPEGTERRLLEFEGNMQPVLEYYKSRSCLEEIDGNGTPDACRERFVSFHHSKVFLQKAQQ